MKRLLGLAGLLSALLVLFSVGSARADVDDFVITDFDADYTLTNRDPQGQLAVKEEVAVDFNYQNHGILRAIPTTYKAHQLLMNIESVSSASGAPTQYETYESNGNTVLKIGDPNRTVTGKQQYTIRYTLSNVMGFYDDHDEFYWDINGDQWAQSAQQVTATVHLPDGARLDRVPICYGGTYGSTTQNCTSDKLDPHTVRFRTTAPLAAYETLSVVMGVEKGFFHPSAWYETLGEYWKGLVAFFVPFFVLSVASAAYWFRRGRDAKGRGVIVPQYDAPDGLRPIEVGTLVDFKTDNRDITATIIDLAVRGYITVVQQTKVRKLRRDQQLYSLRLRRADFSSLGSFEITLLDSLFGSHPEEGKEVDLTLLKFALSKTATQIRKSLKTSLTSRGYFKPNVSFAGPGVSRWVWTALWLLVILFSVFHAPAWGIAGLVCGVLIAAFFLYFVPSRTAKGVEAYEHVKGLQLYLKTAEADRLKMLQSPNAAYMPASSEPKRTVHLFEKLLPYAMALGVEQQWAKQFEDIYRTPPDWYSGNWHAFNAVYLTSALSDGIQPAVNSAFSSPSSSSGSGFGGGGAGGGGGGGGGGGW